MLANLIGRSRASIANMEGERQTPHVQTSLNLAEALEVSIGVLLGSEPLPVLPVRPLTNIELAYIVTCSQCGKVGEWEERDLALAVQKSHNEPHSVMDSILSEP